MDVAAKYDACVEALRTFMAAAGFSDVVIGLSGGIDSAVVAVMSVDALGADHVHAYLLPGPYSTDHSLTDAQAEADALGISAQVLSIKRPSEAFASVLAPACGGSFEGMASQNTQARCRMICLMALSNQ